jgi:hypothetical protein
MESLGIRGRLFTARGFILATIIGGVLGAAVLLSINFYYLRQNKLAIITWTFALAIMICNYFLVLSTDIGISLLTRFFVLFIGMWTINKFQQEHIDQYVNEGNKTRPAWLGSIIGLICFGILIGVGKLTQLASA